VFAARSFLSAPQAMDTKTIACAQSAIDAMRQIPTSNGKTLGGGGQKMAYL
jgi:hypothetical protein